MLSYIVTPTHGTHIERRSDTEPPLHRSYAEHRTTPTSSPTSSIRYPDITLAPNIDLHIVAVRAGHPLRSVVKHHSGQRITINHRHHHRSFVNNRQSSFHRSSNYTVGARTSSMLTSPAPLLFSKFLADEYNLFAPAAREHQRAALVAFEFQLRNQYFRRDRCAALLDGDIPHITLS